MVGGINDPVTQGMRLAEGGAVAHQGRMGHMFVMLGLDQQHVAAKFGAGAQGAVVRDRNRLLAVAG